MNPPRQPHEDSVALTSTAVPIQINAQDDHYHLLDYTGRKASYPREQIVSDWVVLGWADVFSRRGDLAWGPMRGSMSGSGHGGCASARVGLGGDQERSGSHP